MQVTPDARKAFYEVAALGLHALEALPHGRRRFDADAVARWKTFQGELLESDRLDLLVRDAAVEQPAAFAPRVVFDLPGLASDEPFGPDWQGAEARTAFALLQHDSTQPHDLASVLRAACIAWDTQATAMAITVPDLTAATRILVAGPAAIIAVAGRFQGRAGFDFADQVVVLADRPLERQLAGLAAALLGTSRPARVLTPGATPETVEKFAFHAVLASPDATSATRRAINSWGARVLA